MMRHEPSMHTLDEIVVVVGSHRSHSQSRKVAEQIRSHLLNRNAPRARPGVASVWIMDMAELALPMWDECIRERSGAWAEIWDPLSTRLRTACALVVVSPEWGGMVPAALKNFFLLCESNELAHKAGLIVSVSSGTSGSYPVTELRMSSYKNTRLCYVPDHVIIRAVETVLNTPHEPEHDEDRRVRERLYYALDVFLVYAVALNAVRKDSIIDLETYPYGM